MKYPIELKAYLDLSTVRENQNMENWCVIYWKQKHQYF